MDENKETIDECFKKLSLTNKEGTVISYTISKIECLKPTSRKYVIDECLFNQKVALSTTKNKYDEPYEKYGKKFVSITRHFELSSQFKHDVARMYNTPNVSNAWLKAYEIFSQYKLFPVNAESFVYFDNAAFPGSFVLAAHHYVKTQCNIKNFQWYASSILDTAQLEDSYELYKNYPENWVMDEKNNGDVTISYNQMQFQNRLGKRVDLYTSDLGFDVSKDYNNQETLHANANLGQILTGLLVLKDGGSLVTKQYTFFEPFTVSLIGCLTFVFRELKIIKPMFSKPGNSEVYIFGRGYRYDPVVINIFDKSMLKRSGEKMYPMLTKSCLGTGFIKSIHEATDSIYSLQQDTINNIIKEFYRLKDKNVSANDIKNGNYFTQSHNWYLERWKIEHPLKRLDNTQWLKVKNKLHHFGKK
jgi:hypothetical protein